MGNKANKNVPVPSIQRSLKQYSITGTYLRKQLGCFCRTDTTPIPVKNFDARDENLENKNEVSLANEYKPLIDMSSISLPA